MTDPQIISLSPAIVHFIDLVQGDTAQFTATLEYDDGSPYDLTGYDVNMDIRRRDNSLVLALGLNDGITVADNLITVTIPAANTANLTDDTEYNYDLEISQGSVVRTISWGTIRVMKQRTIV